MKSGQLILVRHAEVDVSYKGVCYGAMDVALSARGRDESTLVARRLADKYHPSIIFHSGLSRTRFLADQIAQNPSNAPPVCPDLRLRERDYGQWQGKTWDENHSSDPTGLDQLIECPDTYRPPGGETTSEIQQRVVDWYLEIVQNAKLVSGATIMAVSHSGPIAALCGYLSKTPATQWQSFMVPTLGMVKIHPRCDALDATVEVCPPV